IAILIVQDVAGSMRLEAAHAERQADVAKVGGDVIVERLNLVEVGGFALDEFGFLGANFCIRLSAIFFESGVPAAELVPTFKGGQLNRRVFGLFRSLLFGFFFLLFFLVGLVNVRARPGVNAAAILLGDFGIVPRLRFEFDLAIFRDVDTELLVENGAALREVVLHPELAGSERRLSDRHEVIFEFDARANTGYGNVLLAVIGIDGRFFLQRDAQVLYSIGSGRDGAAIGVEDAHEGNLNSLIGGVVSHDQLAPLLNASFILNFDAGVGLATPGAVVLEAIRSAQLFDDIGFLRVVGGRSGGCNGRSGWRRHLRGCAHDR